MMAPYTVADKILTELLYRVQEMGAQLREADLPVRDEAGFEALIEETLKVIKVS
jgi:hypothetical protein